MNSYYNIIHCGDHALTVELGETLDYNTHLQVMDLFQRLLISGIRGVKDIIPAYTSVTIVYDIAIVKSYASGTAYQSVKKQIEEIIKDVDGKQVEESRHITIPVCYDISLGIDLENMSAEKSMSIDNIINLHTQQLYDVYLVGFLPGFAYMGIVDERIATPRLSKPRMQVPAGSVGIAGNQTGIYPLDSPGGWNIIGQTPLQMFDVNREDPCLLKPGDKIQFKSIGLDEFNKLTTA